MPRQVVDKSGECNWRDDWTAIDCGGNCLESLALSSCHLRFDAAEWPCVSAKGVSPQGVSPQGVSPQGVSPQGVSPQGLRDVIKGAHDKVRVGVG